MKQIDELIRGEMSAVKSIDAILPRLKDTAEIDQLMLFRRDHFHAVDKLKQYAGADYKVETSTSGPWGAFASAFTGGASFFGDKAALSALKVGEQHGLNEYREALEGGDIDMDVRRIIETELIPAQERHLQAIDRYIQ